MKKNYFLYIFISFFITACAGPSEKTMLPEGGPTTLKVYNDHLAGKYNQVSDDQTSEDFDVYIRTSDSYIQPGYETATRNTTIQLQNIAQDFRRINNPEIVGYVYPHLSPGQHPIPGYFTVFPLYPASGYALTADEGIVR